MLADLEWNCPTERPGGRDLAQWVEGVRWLERNGWLKDPRSLDLPEDPQHPARRAMAVQDRLCLALCWRKRCLRAGRCRHYIGLAIREFMPELSLYIAHLSDEAPPYRGPVTPAKMAQLAQLFGLRNLDPALKPRRKRKT